ncbi:isochorismatase family protein [Streptacidiphilus sp. EB103A]|uniref:isochorismatase family protein n=1 Tax=Streptacidiphilus sp. EB103A TaxID=3156275 RepID=UPI003516C1F4
MPDHSSSPVPRPEAVDTFATPVVAQLHQWAIPPREYARMESRRGRRHAYEQLTPAQTALVVVDMVAFFADDSAFGRAIVPQIRELAVAMRQADGTVAWVLPVVPERANDWGTAFYGRQTVEVLRTSGGQGTVNERLCTGLDADPGDLVVEKRGTSAFWPGNSTLPGLLVERGVDTVVVCGMATAVIPALAVSHAGRVVLADLGSGCRCRIDRLHGVPFGGVARTYQVTKVTSEVARGARSGRVSVGAVRRTVDWKP